MSEFELNCKTKKLLNYIPSITPRGGACMIECEKFILLFGGANRQQEHYNDLHLCTRQNDSFKWEVITSKGDIPPPRSGHSMCQFQNYIFLFGGIDFENEAIYNDLYMLNTVNWEWKYVGEAGEEISPRNSHTLNILHVNSIPYLVLYGGASPELGPLGDSYYAALPKDGIAETTDSNSTTENTTEFFVTWKKINSSPSPCPREMFSSSVYFQSSLSSSLVIAGGRTVDAILSDVWTLTGRTSTTTATSETPVATTTVEETNSAEGKSETNNNTEPEVIFEWQQLFSYELPHPRCAHTSWILTPPTEQTNSTTTGSNFEMIIFGGFTGQGISDDIIYCKLNSNVISSSSSSTATTTTPLTASSTRWIPLETSQSIPGRFGHVMCQSPAWMIPKKQQKSVFPHSTVLLYGGIDAEQDFNDLWMVSLPNHRTI